MTVSQDSHETLLREDPKLLTVLLNCHNCHICLLSSSLVLLPADTPTQPKDNSMTHKTDMPAKISALMAKSANDAATPAEAEAYAAKAAALMAKYAISEDELPEAHRVTIKEFVIHTKYGNANSGVQALIIWTYEAFGAYGVSLGTGAVRIYTTQTTYDRVTPLVGMLTVQAMRLVNEAKPRSRRSWMLGYAHTVSDRIRAEVKHEYSKSTDVVLHPQSFKPDHLKVSSPSVRVNDHDSADGRRAGSSADVGHARVTARPELSR